MGVSAPISAVPWRTSVGGMAGFAFGLALASTLSSFPVLSMLVLLGFTAAPMWCIEWLRFRASAIELRVDSGEACGCRKWRLLGVLAVAALWALTLNTLPLANGAILHGFWVVVTALWPFLLLAVVWFVAVPKAGPVAGLELIGQWLDRKAYGGVFPWHVLRDHFVKAFFLPLMIAFSYAWASQVDVWGAVGSLRWYSAIIALLYLVDTVFGTIGYISTSRRFDAHIRSSNPLVSGWLSALICYPPFFTWLQQFGFNYRDGVVWSDWLSGSGLAFHLWGAAIIAVTSVYALSTVVFGIRFSNLTNRGIITHGPYRWVKHPAYLSKNVSWWLVSIPFISYAGPGVAVIHCAVLLCVNGIYWSRAKTEELHLMSDPDYRAYVAWIDRNGLVAHVRLLFGLKL